MVSPIPSVISEAEYHAQRYRENRAAILKRFKDRYLTEVKPRQFLKKYGITIEAYNEQLKRQDYRCACCKRRFDEIPSKRKRAPSLDHNHDTDEPRGILCDLCNMGIGCLQDSPVILQFAIDYLRAWAPIAQME